MPDVYRQLVDAAKALVRDRRNRYAYGPDAPRVAERIWVEPRAVEWSIRVLPKGVTTRNSSALVVDYVKAGIVEMSLMNSPQVRSCYQHWCEGVPWEDTEDYAILCKDVEQRGRAAGCRSIEAIRRRFSKLDELFVSTARGDGFKSQKELHLLNFREHGGVQIGINGFGRPTLVKGCGYHRLAIARILGLKKIPAQIGVVDVNAIELLPSYRAN